MRGVRFPSPPRRAGPGRADSNRVAPVRHLVRRLIPFFIGAAAVVFIMNAVVSTQHLPEYASWTGIRPLEEKLHKLDRFSSHGRVDALILGSSISDFGLSANVLSEKMTAATGKPYRVFNFSTGATEIGTMPALYRMARTASKPRMLLLSIPEEIKRSNELAALSPDYILRKAPIGTAIAHPWLFPLEKRFFDIPLVRYAAPLRDGVVFGRYEHLPSQGSDLYWIDDSGDSVSFSYQTKKADLSALQAAHIATVVPLTQHQMSTWSQCAKAEYFFNRLDIDAMGELRKLTAADGCQIVVIAHDVASDYYPAPPTDPAFVRARRQFYAVLAAQMHARVINETETFKAQQYMVMDTVHLNQYGSEAFTRLVAADLTHSAKPPLSQRVVEYPTLPDTPSSDVTISGFTALVDAPKRNDGLTLKLRILRNHAIPPLPDIPLRVMLRLPDNTDVSAPARLTSSTSVEATFDKLPLGPNKMFLARIVYDAGGRLVAHNQPIAAYTWSK
jgi:hypothetical protein